MTSTLRHDELDVGHETCTRDMSTYRTRPPVLRRSDATGEFPFYQPQTIGNVDEQARRALEATLVHQFPLPPIDSLPEAVRRPAPTTHRAAQPEPDPVRPPGYRGTRRMVAPPPATPSWPWLVLPLVGALLMVLTQVALLQVAIRVSGAVL